MFLYMILACNQDSLKMNGVPAFGYSGEELPTETIIADESDGLHTPRDLAFDPAKDGELWVVNRADDSITIIQNTGAKQQESQHLIDPYALHFMEEVSSISFGIPYHFGTCQESRNTYNGDGFPNTFMGPTLWSSDLNIFATSNPEAVEYLSDLYGENVDLGSHLDMLHESPLCMGIEWEKDNVYWVFDGHNQSIARYDFKEHHGVGYDDHSDGVIVKYMTGEVSREPDVPSHLKLHRPSGMLYIADTGNNAIKRLDITSGTANNNLPKEEPGTTHFDMTDEDFTTIVDGIDYDLVRPSGLTIVDDTIIVGDNATGKIYAFDLDGALIDSFQTQAAENGLMGIYASSLDDIWYVDAVENLVWRLQAESDVNKNRVQLKEYTTPN
jgi:hypothetical protein